MRKRRPGRVQGQGPDRAMLSAVRTAASRGVVLRIDGESGLAAWLRVREACLRVRGADASMLATQVELRAEVYEELLELSPALFRTRGELTAARGWLEDQGWGRHLLPDMRVDDATTKPVNRAQRRALAKVQT